jgi:hypothetical protein
MLLYQCQVPGPGSILGCIRGKWRVKKGKLGGLDGSMASEAGEKNWLASLESR